MRGDGVESGGAESGRFGTRVTAPFSGGEDGCRSGRRGRPLRAAPDGERERENAGEDRGDGEAGE